MEIIIAEVILELVLSWLLTEIGSWVVRLYKQGNDPNSRNQEDKDDHDDLAD